MKILLTRHGHVEGIEPPRFRGRVELPLTPLGEAQALALARRIAERWKPDAIYTSPMGRCIATGHAIGAACGRETETIADLTDLDYGDWHWRLYDEMRQSAPELFNAWMTAPHLVRFPHGESFQDMAARAGNVVRFALARHPRDTVVLVGHDSINRAMLVQLLDQPLSAYWRVTQAPCCLNEIDIDGTSITVSRLNETSHIEALG